MLVGILIPELLSAVLLVGIGLAVFLIVSSRYQKSVPEEAKEYIEEIEEAQNAFKRLDYYYKNNMIEDFLKEAELTIPRYGWFERTLQNLSPYMSDKDYNKLAYDLHRDMIITETRKRDLTTYPRKSNATNEQPAAEEKGDVDYQQVVPELQRIICAIKESHTVILQELEERPPANKEELVALHVTQMDKFEDILEGYILIKKSPGSYKDAQPRLDRAKSALEKLEKEADKFLQDLCEGRLSDFEVSLRLVERKGIK